VVGVTVPTDRVRYWLAAGYTLTVLLVVLAGTVEYVGGCW
jgi:hypothetical protein